MQHPVLGQLWSWREVEESCSAHSCAQLDLEEVSSKWDGTKPCSLPSHHCLLQQHLRLAPCFLPYLKCCSCWVTVQGAMVSQSLIAIRSFLISAFLAGCPWLFFWFEGEALSKHRTGNWELLGSHASSHAVHLGTWASPFNVFCLSFPFYSWEEINTSSIKDSQLIC